jgi:hypothetical protein
MKSRACVKFAALGILSLFVAAFAWSAARGQMRLPRPPMPGGPFGPRMNPPNMPGLGGGPRIVKVWRCTGCGNEIGRGLNAPPSTCPHCGARIINGIGNGIPQAGMGPNPTGPMIPPGFNPNQAAPANPPEFNPTNPPDFNGGEPVVNAPVGDNAPEANVGSGSGSVDSSNNLSSGTRKGVVIALVIGIIVVGASILVGGTLLLIYAVNGNGSSPSRRRRRRDEDYDDRS